MAATPNASHYTEVCVTFLSDDINSIGQQGMILSRVCEILNPFLEKYQILNEDYRILPVSMERNFYFATCHTSPLEEKERELDVKTLFDSLQSGRASKGARPRCTEHFACQFIRTPWSAQST